jgi:HEAT repeat protein
MIAIGVAANAEETIRRIQWWSHVPTYVIIALAPYANDLPRKYQWEFDSRVMIYESDPEFMERSLQVARPLTARQSRLLSRVAFRIVRDQPNHPLHRELIGCLGLSDAGHDEIQKLLLTLILDPDELTREYAARALLNHGPDPDQALEPLMQALATYPPRRGTGATRDLWRTYIIRTIGSFGPRAQPATDLLINQLSAVVVKNGDIAFGHDVSRDRAIIQALGRIGPPAAVILPLLHATDEQLEGPRGDDYEERVAELLISGTCKSEDEARATLFSHPVWRVRRAAASGSWLDKNLDPKAVPYLLRALNDESSYVRQTAAETLLRHNVERDAAYQSLLRPDPGQSDAWTRVQILWRYELDPKPVLPQLDAELAESDNPVVRQNIAHMIELVKSGVRPKNGNF